MRRVYRTSGVCATSMEVETDGETVTFVSIRGGCRGQANALSRLVVGRRLDDVIPRLRGTECRDGTSCADQLGRILEKERDRITAKGVSIR